MFSGPEIGEKKEIIKLIEDKLFPNQEAEKYTFYCGGDFDIVKFMDALKSGLLFSQKKIILLKNIEMINSSSIKRIENYIIPKVIQAERFENEILSKITDQNKKKFLLKNYYKEEDTYRLNNELKVKDKKSIVEILYSINYKNYNKDTYLIMLNETNDKIPQGLIDLFVPQQNIIFWEMFESQKINWLRLEFKKYDLYIDDEAISFILDMIENNKEQLEKEVNKISALFNEAYKSGKKVIDRPFFEEYLYHSKIETPFSLYSAMLNKNLQKAIDILETLFLTDEIGLLNGLVWSHRRFLKALDLYENQKMTISDVFSTLKITVQKNKEDFKNGLKVYNFNHASLMFYYISELDYYLKILPGNLKLIKLQEFVINFVNGDTRKSFLQGSLQFLQS